MGIYKYDPSGYVATDQDIQKMLDLCETPTEKLAICLLWLTGARPMELMVLTREDFTIKHDLLQIGLNTLKLQKARPQVPRRRLNQFKRGEPPNPIIECVVQAVEPLLLPQLVLPKSKRWLERLTKRLGQSVLGKDITPYHFRHWRLTIFADKGMSMTMIRTWKGAAGFGSIDMYISRRDSIVDDETLKSD
jgi:integrase